MLLHLAISGFLASIGLMLLFPRTPTARAIRRIIVTAPSRFLLDLSFAKAGRLALSVGLVGFMLTMPEMAMLMASLGADAAILEVLLIVWVASVSGGFSSLWRSIRQIAAHALRIAAAPVRGPWRPRSPHHRRSRPAHGGKDDAGGQEWAFA